ncbi:hypothetical protein Gasu2_63560 [Galdieria sulphuraria]|uniref:Uncharacterized protein n=1 Tax=Galdieria sulphuraria TaxID=130081 RepID=M2WWM5_GALSU|nr:uncharacterized protein Gasu_40960 [Galdieria sulphuraria]EME28400.1 hypothetical protein Gasu_40960 [Galdieria sulphuraria]GJD12256.1 hypothetical protein Gasu2_63560 [Galdieria sulphuraria]|eukprot:XP_005704920.1 hypothetical protein Gasu_40960 [Galdieria sulphuraria]
MVTTKGVDIHCSQSTGKQTLLRSLLQIGVSPERVENYYEILCQFFTGKLAKYQLEEKLKSLLSPQAIQVHNETFIQVLQQAQQGGNTLVPSLTTHEKDSKYLKRRLLVKRPIKSITCWNDTQESYPESKVTGNKKRKRNNMAKVQSAHSLMMHDKDSLGETITKPSLDRKAEDNMARNSREEEMTPTFIYQQWKDAIQQHFINRISKRMKQIAAENGIYQIDKDATIDLFHALEFHLLDIIKGTREPILCCCCYEQRKNNKYLPRTLSIRDLYRFVTEYAQDALGDPYSIDRISLAFF